MVLYTCNKTRIFKFVSDFKPGDCGCVQKYKFISGITIKNIICAFAAMCYFYIIKILKFSKINANVFTLSKFGVKIK